MQTLSATPPFLAAQGNRRQTGCRCESLGNPDPKEQANVNATATEPIAPIKTYSYTCSTTSRTKVALQVVPVEIMNNDGHSVTTYAQLDTGSEKTFLSKTISDRLGLEVNNCNTLAVCTLSVFSKGQPCQRSSESC